MTTRPQPVDIPEGDFYSDGEYEEDDPYLGQRPHGLRRFNHAEDMGTDDHAQGQVT